MKKSIKTFEFLVQDIKPGTINSFKDIRLAIFDSIPKGGFRSTIDVYRTKIGNGFFKFRFHRIEDYYEIDVLAMPSYNSRLSDCHITHLTPSVRGGYKIDASFINTISIAKKIAAEWSELTMNYILSGSFSHNLD